MKPLLAFLTIILTTIAQIAAQAAPAPAPNLLKNPGFEEGRADLPAHWKKTVIGVAPEFSLDASEHHGGKKSARISAKEQTRAYLESEAIEVVPGEKIHGSAWVKVTDVPSATGAVILIAHFSRADGTGETVEKFNTAKIPTATQPGAGAGAGGWQHIDGTVTVPEDIEHLTIRAGFSYASGTCWWDDVTIEAVEPVVARIKLPEGKLTPALEPLPVTILNRTADRSRYSIEVKLDKKSYSADAQLDGKPTQVVDVPIKIEKRGKTTIDVSLSKSNKPVFSRRIDTIVPPPVIMDPPSPTHWVIEDGPAKITGDILLALKQKTLDGANMSVQLQDSAGAVKGNWSSDDPKDGVNTWSITAPNLPQGEYKLTTRIQPKSGEALAAETDFAVIPRRLAKVTINPNGYCVYDGKAIYPLGIYNSGLPKELAEAGFTLTHAYNATRVFTGQRPPDKAMRDYLDSTEKAGMKSCCMVPLVYATKGDWEAFRRRIRMFRNHPAILCWDEEEGLARGDWTMETLAKAVQITKEEDPNHPFMVGDARDVIGRIKDRGNFFPLAHMDLGMWWWYPLPLKRDAHIDPLEGVEVSGLELSPPEFLVKRNTSKPIWVACQSYAKGKDPESRQKGEGRFPNAIEYRAQPYIAIAEGAQGVMWYGGYVTGGIFQGKNREEGDWPALKKVVTELRSLDDCLVEPNQARPSITPEKSPLSVAIKKSPKRTILIAVNRGEKSVEVKIASPMIKPGSAQVINESRTVESRNGELSDRFAPYEAHVYEMR